MTEKLLKPAEAAKELGISYRNMLDLIASGEMESVPVGKRRYINQTAIERWQYRALGTPPPKIKPKAKKKSPSMRELMAREAALKGPIPRRRYGT